METFFRFFSKTISVVQDRTHTEAYSMEAVPPQLQQLKSAMKSAWMAGDFGEVAKYTAEEAENFVARVVIPPGARVLDVACGTGNTAIPVARGGAEVIGVDIATNLLAQAEERAKSEGLRAHFQEGDAEHLPFGDGEFDVVLTMYGAMFAPRPDRVAGELARVCKPGGKIAMANWTPEGFVGKNFRITAKHVPPPPGIPAPVLWGVEHIVRARFGESVSKLTTHRKTARFQYPFAPGEVVGFFRQYFGPTKMAFSRLDTEGQTRLADELQSLWAEHNQDSNGGTMVDAEYLEVHAVRA
jgi:SAM-dependent methyltransferase